MNDFLLQKRSDRGSVYHQEPGIWFSDDLQRWIVTSPDLIRQVMHDDGFAVPTYDVTSISEKLGVDLGYIQELRNWLPLAHEGGRHKFLREQFARLIANNLPLALSTLSFELAKQRDLLLAQKVGENFCFQEQVLQPITRSSLSVLAGLDLSSDVTIEVIPQMFDDAISLSRRKLVNETVRHIIDTAPRNWTHEQKYLACSIVALGANTLIGTIGQTFIKNVTSAKMKKLSEIEWQSAFIRTALPLVEKRTTRDTRLGPYDLKAGSRLRLFIEADGVLPKGEFNYSDLFFAVGPHKCVGMNFSKVAWSKFSEMVSSIDRRMSVLDVHERSGDYVFNFPDVIKVQFDD